jgi:sodium/potassium-transporting ATPase subunit alpha
LHWFPAVPWSMFIFTYDELRKALMRGNPDGWLNTYTYW